VAQLHGLERRPVAEAGHGVGAHQEPAVAPAPPRLVHVPDGQPELRC
jgi:hypothetical protein